MGQVYVKLTIFNSFLVLRIITLAILLFFALITIDSFIWHFGKDPCDCCSNIAAAQAAIKDEA